MLSFKLPNIFVVGWFSLTFEDGSLTRDVEVPFCFDEWLHHSAPLTLHHYASLHNQQEVSHQPSINLSWIGVVFFGCAFKHTSSLITTFEDSMTVLVLRLYTLYALLVEEYPRKYPLSLFASNFSKLSLSRRMNSIIIKN